MGEVVALILLGALVGALIGGLGGGGGVIGIPAFLWLAGVSASDAGTLSLMAVAAAAVVAVVLGGRAREIRWRWVLVFGLMGIVGAVAGSAVASVVDDLVILIAFGVVVVVATVRFLVGVRRQSRESQGVAQGGAQGSEVSRGGAALAAVGIGGVTGLVGVGGGFLIAPALMRLVKMAPRLAIGTSSAVILFNCLSSLAARMVWGFDIDPAMALPVLGGAVAGAVIGRAVSQRASNEMLRYASGALLIICCIAVGASVAQALWTL